MIEVQHVGHTFASQRPGAYVLDDVDTVIPDGTFVSIVGPSGCGKTTLLRIVDGLLAPTFGHVECDGRRVVGPSAERALVFQDFRLLPWRTALGNVQFGLEAQGVSAARRRRLAAEALERVGLASIADRYPHQLSGGMQQRVGFARALCTSPRYLLMDEPFGSIDLHTRELMQKDLLHWWEHDRRTVLMVTHSIDEAVFLSDRVLVMSASPGRVEFTLDVRLPRPRWHNDESIRSGDQFLEYRAQLWDRLKRYTPEALAC